MIRFNLIFAFAMVAVLSMTNCRSAKRYVESGDYDAAIDRCVDKLAGKKNKPDDLVKGLELAFKKATDRDMRAVETLTAENRPDNWARINDIHRQIQLRQDKVNPLIPLKSKDGYEAKFMFVNIEKLEFESRSNAAEYLYKSAQANVALGRKGDKKAAREAWETLGELERRYFTNYKDKEALKSEASELGISHVYFEIKNESNRLLPRDFNERILSISKQDLDTRWKRYHLTPETGVKYDYKAVFQLQNIDISPERIREREYTDEKEIQDGWEYVYDSKGNVKKDSSGNDIKHPRYVLTRANILEVLQTKAARITGQIAVFETNRATPLEINPVAAEVLFENYASTFTGDNRALSDDSRRRIGNRPLPFPADDDMLAQAADRLKPEISNGLRRFTKYD